MPFRILLETNDAKVGLWNQVLVINWTKEPSIATSTELHRVLPDATKMADSQLAVVLVLTAAAVPAQDVRESLQSVLKEVLSEVVCMATVIRGKSVQATAVRAVINAMRIFVRAAYPTKTFNTMQPALSWLVANLESSGAQLGWTVERLEEEVQRAFGPESDPPAARDEVWL